MLLKIWFLSFDWFFAHGWYCCFSLDRKQLQKKNKKTLWIRKKRTRSQSIKVKDGNKNEQKGSKLFNSFVKENLQIFKWFWHEKKNEERKLSWRRKQVKWLNEDLYFPFCCLENFIKLLTIQFSEPKKRQMYNKKPFARKIGRFEWK